MYLKNMFLDEFDGDESEKTGLGRHSQRNLRFRGYLICVFVGIWDSENQVTSNLHVIHPTNTQFR